MLSALAILVSSLLLAAVVGFAAHRASICTVKAVEEIYATRRALMFASFAKTGLWIMAAVLVMQALVPDIRGQAVGWTVSIAAITGGLIFGVGAVVNGGCAFSTLTQLGAGKVAMLITLLGFALGSAVSADYLGWGSDAVHTVPYLMRAGSWTGAITAVLLIWVLWEVFGLWRGRPAGSTWRQRLVANRYRLSSAAALMGIANAVLYGWHGTWPYTKILGDGVRQLAGIGVGTEASIDPMRWALFGALVVGVVASARIAKSFKLDWRPRAAWLGNLAGGALMGAGAGMIPGGNDVLLLSAIPLLSPHAIPAYLGVVVGIAATLALMHAGGRASAAVDCQGDVCNR